MSDYSWSSSPFTSQIPSSVGIWGHGSVVYNDFILYFGGYPAEWGSSALQYFIANDTFTSIDTIPTNTWPYPSAKRSFSTCTFKNGLNNEHVIVFGGISDTPSQEMNVLLLEEKRFSWASTNISSVVLMSQTDEFSTLKLNGWGFVDSESRSGLYNYVVLETLGDSSECILKHASFSEIVCVTSKFYPESTISLKIMRYADDYLESQGSFVLKTEDGKDQPASSTFIQSTIPGYSTRPPSTVITSVIRETATVIVDAGSLPGISGVANVPLSILVPAILGIVFVSFICGVSAVFCVRHFRSKGLYRKKMNSEEKYESMDTVCNNA